jgi:OOP family OmpA-OmpF porin
VPPPEPPPAPKDRDGDGVTDGYDACPDEPGLPDRDGCPPPPDTDGDGFPDSEDKCPQEAGVEEYGGCPIPDSDGDGFLDPDDKCPQEPESKNGYQDDDGCHDELPEPIKEFSGVIEGITFGNDSDKIRRKSRPVLDKAIKVLKEFPEVSLEIVGHTDDRGSREHNLDLSKRRAASVVKYLVDGGIDGGRLRSRGAGPDEELVPNDSAENRAKNRRTEFHLLTKDELKGGSAPAADGAKPEAKVEDDPPTDAP